MNLWLSRQRDGNYMLTTLQPVESPVGQTAFADFYVQPGESIGVRHLCSAGVKHLFGIELGVGEQCQVVLRGEVLNKGTVNGD